MKLQKLGMLAGIASLLIASTAFADHYEWHKGDRLEGGHYHGHYTEVSNWQGEHLHRPPEGYHWVRDDEGQFVLAAVATGVVAEVVANAMAH